MIMENVENVRITTEVIDIANVCHQANKAWCEANGDFSQLDWDYAEQWQIDSAINGVRFRMANPDTGTDAQHNNWMKEKVEDGWVFGQVKDPEKKIHPCIIPFDKLPVFQQKKDILFSAIIDVFLETKEFPVFNTAGDQSEEQKHFKEVIANKRLRVMMDKQLQNLKSCPPSRERSLSITKLQEAIMWLGMDLKRLDEPNPYPNSYNPGNTIIDPIADNLKL